MGSRESIIVRCSAVLHSLRLRTEAHECRQTHLLPQVPPPCPFCGLSDECDAAFGWSKQMRGEAGNASVSTVLHSLCLTAGTATVVQPGVLCTEKE